MSVFCKRETGEWDEIWRELGEITASEGEKSAEKEVVHAERLGKDGKQVTAPLHRAICTAGPSSRNVLSEAIMAQMYQASTREMPRGIHPGGLTLG